MISAAMEIVPLLPGRWEGAPVRYPDSAVRVLDPRFARYRIGNTPIQRLHTGMLWAEGPAWNPVGHYLVWSDIPNDTQLRWLEEDGHVSVLRRPSGNSNGNFFDRQGRQLSCEHANRRVVRYEHDGTLTVLAERAARPGLIRWAVLGAGVLVLEEYEHAKARGAKIYAEVAGYGATSDGFDMVAPSGEGAVRCMRQALSTVKCPIDYINPHATATPVGDAKEIEALREKARGLELPSAGRLKRWLTDPDALPEGDRHRLARLAEHSKTIAKIVAMRAELSSLWSRSTESSEQLLARLQDLGEGRLAAMDKGGIEMQLLSLAGPGVEAVDAREQKRVDRHRRRCQQRASRQPDRRPFP